MTTKNDENVGTSSDQSNVYNKFTHGRISFILREVHHEYGQKYIRVPSNANPVDIILFMRDVWKLECPMIVLSVLTGRSTDKEWQSRKTMNAFKSAIKNAAVDTNMWVLTHGMNFGITRIIGEAYNEELNSRATGTVKNAGRTWTKGDPSLPLVLIGISPVSSVVRGEAFTGSDVFYTIMGCPHPNNQTELDPHHTHYILVDDTTLPMPNKSLNLRAKIERKLVRSEPFRTGRFIQTLVSVNDEVKARRPCPMSTLYMQDTAQTVSSSCAPQIQDNALPTDERNLVTLSGASAELSNLIVTSAKTSTVTGSVQDEDKDMLKDVVPIICMVIGGGLTTLRDVAERVHLGIPILICKGSGFSADTLAYAYEELGDESDAEFQIKLIRPEVSSRLSDAFPNTEQSVLDECLGAVMEVINSCRIGQIRTVDNSVNVMSIFDTRNWKTDPTRLHNELLLTLLKCQRVRRKHTCTMSREQVYRQMQLLLDWNVPDIAQMELFDREDVPVYAIPVHIFEQAFVRPKREAFVELFLDRNFQIQRFFTRPRVRRWLVLNTSDFFQDVCINQLLKEQDSLENYDVEDDISPLINLVVQRLTGLHNIFKPIELRTRLNNVQLLRIVSSETQSFTALTIVAALLNRHDLARVLLKRSEYPIPVALFCSLVYSKLSHFCRESFMKRQIKDHATEMSDYAVGMLDLCFKNTAHCSPTEILDQPHPDFNNLTTIQIAYKAKVMQFISHPLCQRWISEKYYGGLRFLDLSFGLCRVPIIVKVLSCATLIVPSIWWVSLDSTEERTEKESSPEIISDENSIKYKYRLLIVKKLWEAPITKFYFNLVAYLLFLVTLGFGTLWPSCGNLLLDTFIEIWICLMTIEIARCTYISYTNSDGHIAITHNLLDIFFHIIFIILFFWARLFGNWNQSVTVLNSKFILCLGVLYFTYRVPFVYMAISESLGPQLVWIEYTITHDFADFVKLLLLAIFAGGVTINAMIYPYWPMDETSFSRIIARAFLAMFITEKHDLELDPSRTCVPPGPSSQICRNQSAGISSIMNIGRFSPYKDAYTLLNLTTSCPIPTFRGWIFAIQHFILMKLFLMTILYAMFNNSSQSVAKYSSLVWMFKRYENVMAFKITSTLPPPFTVIFYFVSMCKYLKKNLPICWKRTTKIAKNDFSMFKRFRSKNNQSQSDDSDKSNDFDQLSSMSTQTKSLHRTSAKDGNYWRLLAQEYVGKREEGLISLTSNDDTLKGIRKKLLGERSSTISQNRQVEVLKTNMNHIKEHVNHMDKSIDKLSEKLQTVQDNLAKFGEELNTTMYKEHYDTAHIIESHIYSDTLESIKEIPPVWNGVQTVQMICGTKKTIDRRSWHIGVNNGLPYKYNTDGGKPTCPWMVDQSLIKKFPLFGPNHEIRLILTRNNRSECVLIQDGDELRLPNYIIQCPLNGNEEDIVYDLLNSIYKLKSKNDVYVTSIYRGFVEDDKRNTLQAWAEAEYWLGELNWNKLSELNFRCQNLLWTELSKAIPRTVFQCI